MTINNKLNKLLQILLVLQVTHICFGVKISPFCLNYYVLDRPNCRPPQPICHPIKGDIAKSIQIGLNPVKCLAINGNSIYRRLNFNPSPTLKRTIYLTEQVRPRDLTRLKSCKEVLSPLNEIIGLQLKHLIKKRHLSNTANNVPKPVKLPPVKQFPKKLFPNFCDCEPNYL